VDVPVLQGWLFVGAKKIAEPGVLPWLIAATRPGTPVELRVARGPERLVLVLTVVAGQ
jgi:hypothetical protein